MEADVLRRPALGAPRLDCKSDWDVVGKRETCENLRLGQNTEESLKKWGDLVLEVKGTPGEENLTGGKGCACGPAGVTDCAGQWSVGERLSHLGPCEEC